MRWRRSPWLSVTLAALVFLPLLGRRDIVTSHEARVVLAARAMAESGWPWRATPVRVPQVEAAVTPVGERLVPRRDGATIEVNPWLVPILGESPRLQKPPLPYWCAAILFKLFGVSAAAARAVPALLGAAATLLVYDLAFSLRGRRVAAIAAAVWVSSYFIVDEYRKAMADPYLAFFVLATVTLWIRGSRTRSRGALLAAYGAAGLAALAKGPVLLVHVLPILAAYHVATRRRWPGTWRQHAAGVGLFLLIALPWPIAVAVSIPHALEFWRYQSVGTFADNVEKARPWWFYLPNLLLIGLPWTPIALLGSATARRVRRWLPLAAMIVTVTIFSASHVKKNAYLLPMMPLLTLLAAEGCNVILIALRHRGWTTAALDRGLLAVCAGWALTITLFLDLYDTPHENRRSPRAAATLALARLKDEPSAAVWPMELAEEVAVYLPLRSTPAQPCRRFYAIVGNARAETLAEQARALAGETPMIESIPLADTNAKRWQVFRLTFERAVSARPATGESD